MKKLLAIASLFSFMSFSAIAATEREQYHVIRTSADHCYTEGFYSHTMYKTLKKHGQVSSPVSRKQAKNTYAYITNKNSNYTEYEPQLLSKFCNKVAANLGRYLSEYNKSNVTTLEVAAENKARIKARTDKQQATKAINDKYAAKRAELNAEIKALRKVASEHQVNINKAQSAINKAKPRKSKVRLHRVIEKANYLATNLNTGEVFVMVDPFGSYPNAGIYYVHLTDNPAKTTFTRTDSNGFESTVDTQLVTIKPDNEFNDWLAKEGKKYSETIDSNKEQLAAIRAQIKELDRLEDQTWKDARKELAELK
ncbi:hypothetical protein OPW41_17055 [Vibrio europaeus]|uniref:Chromosome segregation ATPase n=1 Tax=Vibrio europaeus TaxID=300876 RepID=A0A178JF23_9VIBR|nr:hypothetical protein [Vibrio europaeus]MDC5707617.1 hypothetical protein [Vibrio europaeus]MDC5709863.1 hypothetical protein [Vibrio europaeus]MDC5716660.1 hypothetical protein [Vibrio europaeus]MDC5722719.1 hypothetical protein [Vibrio europaeus]MDC5726980.1 hypothetical protein [Vibrio europaeus]